MREQFFEPDRPVFSDDDLSSQVFPMDLIHEFPASSARRDYPMLCHGHDLSDAMLAPRDHGGDRRMLRAKSHARGCIDADTEVNIAFIGEKRAAYVSGRIAFPEFSGAYG